MSDGKDTITLERIFKIVAIEFVLSVVISLFTPSPKPLILGLTFGILLSLLNFRLLYLTIRKSVHMLPAKAQVYATSRYAIRYLITGVCLLVSIKAPYINTIGTVMGLLMIKGAIFLTAFMSSKGIFKKVLKTLLKEE